MDKEKELPKEVQDAIISLNVYHYVDVSAAKQGAEIAQSHYEPIIDGLKWGNTEKDKRIAELEAEKYRQNEKYEELARLYGKTVNDLSAANTGKELLKQKVKKLLGLLKEEIINKNIGSIALYTEITKGLDVVQAHNKLFNNYCKKNDIPVGE